MRDLSDLIENGYKLEHITFARGTFLTPEEEWRSNWPQEDAGEYITVGIEACPLGAAALAKVNESPDAIVIWKRIYADHDTKTDLYWSASDIVVGRLRDELKWLDHYLVEHPARRDSAEHTEEFYLQPSMYLKRPLIEVIPELVDNNYWTPEDVVAWLRHEHGL